MTFTLLRKLLRDVRLALIAVCLLVGAFQCLWAKVTERISDQLLPMLLQLGAASRVTAIDIEKTMFEGPGKITKTFMGGENISIFRPLDMMTVGYVHPLMLIVFGVWGIGRAAGAVAGEIDRGTMELLLAQPLARWRLIFTHFCVDLVLIPLICASMWLGTLLGTHVFPLKLNASAGGEPVFVNADRFAPALWNVAALLFAISGFTMWISARSRSRWRVMGTAVFFMLFQFFVNTIGQLWDAAKFLRPLTFFFYYQPQQIILDHKWSVDLGTVWNDGQPLFAVNVLAVLFCIGGLGYLLALWTFTRRDLPAPL
jgi:ABC-2 type transport system permease protein